MGFVVRTFGVNAIRRDQLITRGPRFQIAFDANAAELDKYSSAETEQQIFRMGYKQNSVFENMDTNKLIENGGSRNISLDKPMYQGRYELQRCKVDSVSLGVMPGRRVAAVRWEGVAEGITFVPKSLQQFKSNLYNTNVAKSISNAPGSNDVPKINTPNTNTSSFGIAGPGATAGVDAALGNQ